MLVGHLAAAEAQGDLHLVAVLEEAVDGARLHFVVVRVDVRPDLDLFQLGRFLLLPGGGLLLALFKAQLAVIEQLDDRNFLVAGNFHKVERGFAGRVQRGSQRHDALLLTFFVDQQHAGGADLVIDTWPDLFFDGRIGFWSASYWKTPSGIVERGGNMPVFAGIFKAGCSGPGRGKTQPANFAGARCPRARDPL